MPIKLNNINNYSDSPIEVTNTETRKHWRVKPHQTGVNGEGDRMPWVGHGNLIIAGYTQWNAYDKDWKIIVQSGSNTYQAADIASNWQSFNIDFRNEGPIFTML